MKNNSLILIHLSFSFGRHTYETTLILLIYKWTNTAIKQFHIWIKRIKYLYKLYTSTYSKFALKDLYK